LATVFCTMSKEKKERPKTIPIPDAPITVKSASRSPIIPPGFPGGAEPTPISQSSRGRRTYSVDELLSLREKNQGPKSELKLPDKINRNLLEPSLRKRKYPFVSESARNRSKSDASNPSRWEGKQGKWRDKHRKDVNHIDEIVEEEEHDEVRDTNEQTPDWADIDEEKIKRDVKSFQFQALDRVAEREMFAQTGNIPDKPKLAPKEEPTTTSEDKNLVDSLFRSAAHNSMPQLPENAVDANQLEKSGNKTGASLFGPGLDKGRSEEEPLVRPLGLFDFAGFNRDSNNDGDARDEMRGFGAQDLRNQGDLSRPIGNHLGDRRDVSDYARAIGERSPIMGGASPHRSPASIPEESNRVTEYDLNVTSKLTQDRDPRKVQRNLPSGASNSPGHEPENGASQLESKTSPPAKSNPDPILRLDNILYEITDPVRPCVGGQFFAPARPLTNKELYDYSPKFKEIQDKSQLMRHKQMMRQSMHQQRKRIMMAKYAQAKQMYEKYPRPEKYPPRSRMMDYRRSEYDQ